MDACFVSDKNPETTTKLLWRMARTLPSKILAGGLLFVGLTCATCILLWVEKTEIYETSKEVLGIKLVKLCRLRLANQNFNLCSASQPLIFDETCGRTMFYRFGGLHGFGSEFGIFLRVHAIASHFGYTLLADDSGWNYGKLEDYFLPLPGANCHQFVRNVNRTHAGSTSPQFESLPHAWINHDHVQLSRNVDYIDQLFLSIFVDRDKLEELHVHDSSTSEAQFLDGKKTLPAVFDAAFRAESIALQQIWRPKRELLAMIHELEDVLGLRPAVNDNGLIIGFHLRLGDKERELRNYVSSKVINLDHFAHLDLVPNGDEGKVPLSKRQNTEKVENGFRAAMSLRDQLMNNQTTSTAKPRSTLLLMSDDPDSFQWFQSSKYSREWKILLTNSTFLLKKDDDNKNSVEKLAISKPINRWQKHQPFIPRTVKKGGFHEGSFNKKPLEERIQETRHFVRDLTVLGTRSDGIVFTGSSNVGRLLGLLGGERWLRERPLRSLDVRWHPTGRYT